MNRYDIALNRTFDRESVMKQLLDVVRGLGTEPMS
jgi:hypothetical protein